MLGVSVRPLTSFTDSEAQSISVGVHSHGPMLRPRATCTYVQYCTCTSRTCLALDSRRLRAPGPRDGSTPVDRPRLGRGVVQVVAEHVSPLLLLGEQARLVDGAGRGEQPLLIDEGQQRDGLPLRTLAVLIELEAGGVCVVHGGGGREHELLVRLGHERRRLRRQHREQLR